MFTDERLRRTNDFKLQGTTGQLVISIVKYWLGPHGSYCYNQQWYKHGQNDMNSFLSLGLGQPWPCLDLLPLLPLLFGITFHLQLVLLSYHPIFLRPYHFLKLVSFLGANRTKSAYVCIWLLRGDI